MFAEIKEALKRKAMECNFGSELDMEIRGQFFKGINDIDLTIMLTRARPKTFREAVVSSIKKPMLLSQPK